MARVTFDYKAIPYARGGQVPVPVVVLVSGNSRDIFALPDTGSTQIYFPHYLTDVIRKDEITLGEDTCITGAGGAFMAKKAVLRSLEIRGLKKWSNVDVIVGAKGGTPFPILGMSEILSPYSLTFHVGAKKLTISDEIVP